MTMTPTIETIDQNRRRFLGTAALGVATLGALSLFRSQVAAAPGDAIRPFHWKASEEQLADLRRRIAATRWPEKQAVIDESQGVRLETMQRLARYWQTTYDWRKVEARLNALPQFITEIDGLDIHFIHVRSKHANALPLIVTHGWPGSIIEQLKIIDPLTNPTAHGASASDAFDIVSWPGLARPPTTLLPTTGKSVNWRPKPGHDAQSFGTAGRATLVPARVRWRDGTSQSRVDLTRWSCRGT